MAREDEIEASEKTKESASDTIAEETDTFSVSDEKNSTEKKETEANAEIGDNKEKEEKPKKGSIIRELIIYAVVIVLCVTAVPRYVMQRTKVDGVSMRNTLQDYDNLLVEKVSYYFKDPARFDIITLYPYGRGKGKDYYIKRIIGLPGENVRIDGNVIYIDGKPLEEHYGRQKIEDGGSASEGDGVTLGDDEYFVMGDNRNESIDSRFEVGPVKRENIDGHAFFRICSHKIKKNGDEGKVDFSTIGLIK